MLSFSPVLCSLVFTTFFIGLLYWHGMGVVEWEFEDFPYSPVLINMYGGSALSKLSFFIILHSHFILTIGLTTSHGHFPPMHCGESLQLLCAKLSSRSYQCRPSIMKISMLASCQEFSISG